MTVSRLAKEVSEAAGFTTRLAIGKIVRHPDGRKVKIIDGQYWGTHGLSNWWEWRAVKADGTLSRTKESGYGWM